MKQIKDVAPHFGLFIFSFIVYGLTLAPSVKGGDSGEFIAAAYSWGIAHPPGFPIYVIFTNLFSYLPLGQGAAQVNLFSALISSGTCLLAFLIAKRFLQSTQTAIYTAILFSFSPLIWEYAVSAEAFALNNFFVLSLCYIALKFEEHKTLGWALFLGFWSTFGLSNHHIMLFFSLPLFVRMAFILISAHRYKDLLFCLAIAPLGFLPYLYLPLAFQHNPFIAWGDFTNLKGFFHHFLRKDYGTFRLVGTSKAAETSTLMFYSELIAKNFWYVGLLPLALGLKSSLKNNLHRWLIIIVFSYIFVFSFLSNFDLSVHVHQVMQSRFLLQALFFLILWFAIGFQNSVGKFKIEKKHPGLLLGIITLAFFSFNFYKLYRERTPAYGPFAQQILQPLPKNAILLTQGDHITNPVLGLQAAEKLRQDVIVLDLKMLMYDWYVEQMKQKYPKVVFPGPRRKSHLAGFTLEDFVIKNLQAEQRVFICNAFRNFSKSFTEKLKTRPYGLSQIVSEKYASLPLQTWAEPAKNSLAPLAAVLWQNFSEISWEEVAEAHYFEAIHFTGSHFIIEGMATKNFSLIQEGVDLIEDFVQRTNFEKALAYRNLGLAYKELMAKDRKLLAKMKSNLQKYLNLASNNDPKRAGIQKILDRYKNE